jgi:hypothetical protein
MPYDDKTFAVRIAFEVGIDAPGLLAEWGDVSAQMADIRGRMKPLKAEIELLASRYEGRGQQPSHWDHERTSKIAELAEAERTIRARNGDKVVESALESYAKASPAYQRFLEHGRQERDRLAKLRGDMDGLWAEHEVLTARAAYLKGAVDHANALLYSYRAEAKASGNAT